MKYLLLTISFILYLSLAFAQQLRFDRFDISNGLSQNNVHCLETDNIGNIWVGTLNGVNVYNGYSFQKFQPSNVGSGHMVGSHVLVLGQGQKGDMWLITRAGGLNYYHAALNRFSVIDRSVFGQFNIELASTISQLNDSIVCFTSHTILGIWNRNQHSFETHELENEILGCVKLNSKEMLLYGNFGVKRIKFDPKIQFETLSDESCSAIYRTSEQLYLIRNYGISVSDVQLRIEKVVHRFSNSDLSQFKLSNIRVFAYTNNAFWIGGTGFLICFKNDNNTYRLQKFVNNPDNDYSFKGYTVTHLMVDDINNLWIGTDKNGLSHLNYLKNQFQHYSWEIESITDPESNPVRAICKSKSGELWVGFDREGLGMIDTIDGFHHFEYYYTSLNQKRKIETVRSLFEDSQGTVWIGENSNLCYYNECKKRIESVDCLYGFKWTSRCYVIKEFEAGIITVTSPTNIGFINKQDGSLNTIYMQRNGSSGTYNVRDIVQDKYRNLWVSRDDRGLLKIEFPGLKFVNMPANQYGLSDNKIYSLAISGDTLWLGTNTGLNLFDIKQEKVLATYFETDGLSNNIVYSLNHDDSGNLWMSTNKGISYFNHKTKTFRTFLPDDFFMDDAHFEGTDGTIYYGGYTGVVSFKPLDIESSFQLSKPRIHSFYIENREVYPGDTIGNKVILEKPVSEIQRIDLSYKYNSFSVGFNAYPFDYPNTNRFRYRLNGLHSNWIESNAERKASYTKVPPGNYAFQLQVASAHHVYGETLEMQINIVPPFWRTIWFKIVLIIVLLLVALGVYRFRVKQIQQRNVWLQRKVDEQTSALKEQNKTMKEMSEQLHQSDQSKLQFFTNVSHEFRTPLTIILGHIENITADSKQSIKTIKRNALLLLRLINQVIDLRKLDQNQLNLSVSQVELVAFVDAIVDSFKSLAENKKQKIIFNSNQPGLLVWLDVEKTEMILYNLLSNAIKYSTEGKNIQVVIERYDTQFGLKVIDEGIGISTNEKERIFDRFFRAQNGQIHSGGHGIGLSLVKGLVEMQKGRIDLSSEAGKGSCFSLLFNMGKDHFLQSDFGVTRTEFTLDNEATELSASFVNGFGDKKILLVEDNPELLDFMVGLLEKHYALKTAMNGREAFDLIPDYAPDLIISDIMMPVMDGITFCQCVKTSIETCHIPFILLSAKTDIETQVGGFETGADAYIEKPFHSQLLFARIHSLLKNRENIKAQFMASDRKIPVDNQLSKPDREFIKKVNAIINIKLSDSMFTIEVLSEQMNMSRATFYRKFSELTGIKPADYIRKTRLKQACEMLMNQNITIAQIADNVGFQSVSHFRKSFKDEFGKTPTEIRKC